MLSSIRCVEYESTIEVGGLESLNKLTILDILEQEVRLNHLHDPLLLSLVDILKR